MHYADLVTDISSDPMPGNGTGRLCGHHRRPARRLFLRVRRDAITGLLVTLLFCMFAYKNLGAIHDTTLQRMAALEAIRQLPADSSERNSHGALINPTLAALLQGIRNFHIASDLVTIAALWAMEFAEEGPLAKTTPLIRQVMQVAIDRGR